MPALDARTLRIRGYTPLLRACALAPKDVRKDVRKRLRDLGLPVAEDAQRRAQAEISGMQRQKSADWTQMRVGVTTRLVYVAPQQRGSRAAVTHRVSLFGGRVKLGKNLGPHRPNLATLLMERAMSPALDANIGRVEREFGDMLDKVGADWSRR